MFTFLFGTQRRRHRSKNRTKRGHHVGASRKTRKRSGNEPRNLTRRKRVSVRVAPIGRTPELRVMSSGNPFRKTIYVSAKRWMNVSAHNPPRRIGVWFGQSVLHNRIPPPWREARWSNRELSARFRSLLDKPVSHGGKYQVIRAYNRLSQFTDEIRMRSKRRGHPTPHEYWTTSRIINFGGMMRKTLGSKKFLKDKKVVTPSLVSSMMQNVARAAGHFPISVARHIYCRYLGLVPQPTGAERPGAQRGGRVLDMSAGWGDRLVGALACPAVTEYTGVDPNRYLHPHYRAMHALYNRVRVSAELLPVTLRLFAQGSEVYHGALYRTNYYDIAFTSPPYSDVELYYASDPRKQADKHGTFDAFRDKFLMPMLRHVAKSLRHGGFLVLNIRDYKTVDGKPHTNVRRLLRRTLPRFGLRYLRTEYFATAKVTGGGSNAQDEPLHVFVKR